MEHTTRQSDQVTVVELSGEIDVSCAPQLKDLLLGLLDEGKNQLLVDLGNVSFMDSTALGIFANAFKRAQRAGGDIKFANPREELRRVFSITQTDKIFSIFDSVDEGLSSFQ
ncbi:MAG: anti-sigma B factor antagonist [Chloroflexi bacterium]|nr:MAG: anti-sigma B factor antagonist [Chloroflexota bacterium]RLC77366.1 MAG: anti-sigma B factor antagonist [Chloroflexota bacterium]HEY73066.1 STAS domain-containing protein [Thermoflexia bacterium]